MKTSYFNVGRVLTDEEWASLTSWRNAPENRKLRFKLGDVNHEGFVFMQYSRHHTNGERWKSQFLKREKRVEGPKLKSPLGKYTKFPVGRVLNKTEYEELKLFNSKNRNLRWDYGEIHQENPRAAFMSYSRDAINGEYWAAIDKVNSKRERESKQSKDKRLRMTKEEKQLEREKNRRPENIEQRKKARQVRSQDPLNKLKNNIRSNLSKAFRIQQTNKPTKTEKILGLTFDEFKEYIESLFEPWMNWGNYGSFLGNWPTEINQCWDVDHIIPISIAKTKEDIINLNHHSNLQPLCSYTNRHIKKDSLDFY